MKNIRIPKKHRYYLVIFFLAIIFALCLVKYLISITAKTAPLKPIALMVTTTKIISGIQSDSFDTVGTSRAVQSITICSEAAGVVKQVLFQPGKLVRAGQPIVILDSADLENARAKAQAKLQLVQANFKRYYKLYKLKLYPKAGLEQIQSELESARADLQSITININKRIIRAPFNGQLGIAMVAAGQYLVSGEKIVDLIDRSTLYFDFCIPEIYAPNIHIGDQVLLTSIQKLSTRIYGTISAIDAQIDSSTHTLRILASIDNSMLKLIPGIFMKISLPISAQKIAITIPQTAIVFRQDGSFVYQIKDSHAYLTKIVLGRIQGDQVVVEQGLKIDDQIVKNGQINLYDGALVSVIQN